MSDDLLNRRLIIAKRLKQKYFDGRCPFEKTLQQPFSRFF